MQQQLSLIGSPSVLIQIEGDKVSLVDGKPSSDALIALQGWLEVQLQNKLSIDYSLFVNCWNTNKPKAFAKLNSLDKPSKQCKKRRSIIDDLVISCDRNQGKALQALSEALMYADKESKNPSSWLHDADLTFENFFTNGKVIQFSEKFQTYQERVRLNQELRKQSQELQPEPIEHKPTATKEDWDKVRKLLKRGH